MLRLLEGVTTRVGCGLFCISRGVGAFCFANPSATVPPGSLLFQASAMRGREIPFLDPLILFSS
jgi:hypothetical protein